MAQKRSELEQLAYAALSSQYSRPPSKRVTESANSLRKLLDTPGAFLAYAVLRAHHVYPSDERLKATAQAIQESYPDPEELRQLVIGGPRIALLESQRAEAVANLRKAEITVAQSEKRLNALHSKCKSLEEQLASVQENAKQSSADLESALSEARDIAKQLWSIMPAEGKLRLIESDDDWLPRWVRSG